MRLCRNMRLGRALFVFGLCVVAIPPLPVVSAEEKYTVDIVRKEAQKIAIAVVGFPPLKASPTTDDLGTRAGAILTDDLKSAGMFDVIDPSFLPIEAARVEIGQEKGLLPALNSLKVQAVVVGKLSSRGSELILEGQLFEVVKGEMLSGKRYVGDPRTLRTMVHRLADEVVFRLTGEKGIASSRIAYVSSVNGAKEIYVMDYDAYNPLLITGNHSINLSPRWSPDGKKIAYTSYRDQNPDLFVIDLETGRRQKISSSPGLNVAPAWSPDGERLAFSMSNGTGTNLFLIRPDGAGLRQLTQGPHIDISPSFAPNGRQIVFNSDRGGTPQIYLMDIEGTNVRRLTFGVGDYSVSPRWSPRGDKIAFVGRLRGSFDIFLINPDGTGLVQLTSSSRNNEEPSWSADGRHILFTSTRNGSRHLYIMAADGSNQRRLTKSGQEHYLADWSP
ncbi:Tol-Pal system beta propeller repeat protein TolB [Candidatus Methylomirabilis sp.]|uniref:Tol-Pal system beta propeller repeat protein TolB n=1 Tax=Candidatus Methylomirabilis tolerans TaxID=3123416 RepID=A0AAJ1EJE1_9BACT|nr:Tol-Pal system beta propeller repeat protein TolB [Candidatus Methylomirabilis sp.]